MEGILESRAAKIIVEECASIKKDEKVLIISDFNSIKTAELLSRAVWAANAELCILIIPPRKVDGAEPPKSISLAMLEADVILLTLSISIVHSNATKNALKSGARVLSLTGVTDRTLVSGAFEADFKKERLICENIAKLFSMSDKVRITSPNGTNLFLNSMGRQGNSHHCIVDKPGQMSGAPNIEANFSPVEGSAEGIFVADLSIPYLGIGLLSEPMYFTIESGKVKKIEGGEQAKKIKTILEEQNDPNSYNIAQVAIGLNPHIKEVNPDLGCCYDEGTYGTVHIGIGTSSNLGGKTKASIHFDALMNSPTVFIDEKKILEGGELLINIENIVN